MMLVVLEIARTFMANHFVGSYTSSARLIKEAALWITLVISHDSFGSQHWLLFYPPCSKNISLMALKLF